MMPLIASPSACNTLAGMRDEQRDDLQYKVAYLQSPNMVEYRLLVAEDE
jgi:hypothetical protein